MHHLIILALPVLAFGAYSSCDSDARKTYPTLCRLLDMATSEPEKLADMLQNSSFAAVHKGFDKKQGDRIRKSASTGALPIVTAHGMGDSCFNNGMKSLTEEAGLTVGAYAVCIPTGDTRISDTINGFFLNMDASVDVFAANIRADPQLANGFNAFGLSQGNNLIRGYIQKYNDPPVHTFMSICGINAGVGAFPSCPPKETGGFCRALTEILGDLAYNPFIQNILFQANYFRDPSKTKSNLYKKYSQLAQWENEGFDVQSSRNELFAKTSKYIWVLGTEDTVVWPREGEQWAAMDPLNPFGSLLPMEQTDWYTKDLFGLATADKAGKNNWESFDGEHIAFTDEELTAWLEKYFM